MIICFFEFIDSYIERVQRLLVWKINYQYLVMAIRIAQKHGVISQIFGYSAQECELPSLIVELKVLISK